MPRSRALLASLCLCLHFHSCGSNCQSGRLIFIHLQCWEVLPFCRFQRQRCIKVRVLRAQDFYAPLALKTAKGQHLPALEVYKNQSPTKGRSDLQRQCGINPILRWNLCPVMFGVDLRLGCACSCLAWLEGTSAQGCLQHIGRQAHTQPPRNLAGAH